ncbi:hypothetical protein KCU77_g1627, partial [Aureobasidium melanogenum]
MPLELKLSSKPTDTPITADNKMDLDAADQNESENATTGGKGKHKGKLGDINMAKLILSRNKGHKSSKHKKRTEVAPAPTSPLARETNAHHYKHTTYECGHEIYEDKEGHYLARWKLPDKFTTTKIVDPSDCGCEMNAPGNPLTTVTEHQSEPDVLYKGKPIYSPRDMVQAEETGIIKQELPPLAAMPLVCNLWPRCHHVQWRDENGGQIKPAVEMLRTVEVAVYPWRCQTCADLGYPYYVPRDSHLMNAEIAAEQVLRAAKAGDSFEEVFREADLAAFYEAPKDDYHDGPLGGWGPGAGWDPEIPEYDISSTTSSSAPKENSSTNTLNDQSSTNSVNDISSRKVPSNGLPMLPTNNSFQTAAPATFQHREVIDLTAEDEEVSCTASSSSHLANSPQSSDKGSGYPSGGPQGTLVSPATPPSSSFIPAGLSGAASSSSRAPVAISTGGGLAATTMGSTLVVNGVTFPRIENGKERWYTQCPGRNNSYSRYSDLAKFDTSKGVRVAPKASRAQLEAARRYRTFG